MIIDVYHDTACPWCRIGKRHLSLALEAWEGQPVEVRYRAFFLNPSIPPEGYEFRPYMQAKGGGRIPLEQFFAGPRQAGAAVGLIFNFEAIKRAPNTLLSHRLIALTPAAHKAALIDAVYAAYFEHGRDIGDIEVLCETAASVSLDAKAMRERLHSGEAHAEVLAEVQQAVELGISGVPFFVIDNRYAFSGAHPPAVMLQALKQAAQGTASMKLRQ